MSRFIKLFSIFLIVVVASGCKPQAGYLWENPDSYFNFTQVWTEGLSHPEFSHVVSHKDKDNWIPESGYAWVPANGGEDVVRAVVWRPGIEDRLYPHAIAGEAEGTWYPDDGYKWKNIVVGGRNDNQTEWNPGVEHSKYKNVYASNDEGGWIPKPGYDWLPGGEGLREVVWRQFMTHPDFPHVLSAQQEDSWLPQPGYVWASEGTTVRPVVWQQWSRSELMPHMYAAEQEGYWYADAGYSINKNADGSLTAVALASPDTPSQPDYQSAVGFGILSVVADKCAQPEDDDGFFATVGRLACAITSEAAKQKANEALRRR